MLKKTSKGILIVCNECRKVLTDKINKPIYFHNINVVYLYYGFIQSKKWTGAGSDSYHACDVCSYWLERIRIERKNAVEFAEKNGADDCKLIGIDHYRGNLGDSPYVFKREDFNGCSEIFYEKRVYLISDEDDCLSDEDDC